MRVEDLDVARVGRLHAEDDVAEGAAAEHLAEEPVVDHAEAEASELDRMVGRPQPHLADLVLCPGDAGFQRRRVTVQHLTLERDDLGVDERPGHLQHELRLFGHVEVHARDGRRPRLEPNRGERPVQRQGSEVLR